jgi:hypothetical protein
LLSSSVCFINDDNDDSDDVEDDGGNERAIDVDDSSFTPLSLFAICLTLRGVIEELLFFDDIIDAALFIVVLTIAALPDGFTLETFDCDDVNDLIDVPVGVMATLHVRCVMQVIAVISPLIALDVVLVTAATEGVDDNDGALGLDDDNDGCCGTRSTAVAAAVPARFGTGFVGPFVVAGVF